MSKMKADAPRKVAKKRKGVASDSAASEDSLVMVNSDVPSECEKVMGSEDGYPQDFGGEMSKLLKRFSTDMNETIKAKRRKLEQFTEEAIRFTTKKVQENNKKQSEERRKLIDHFQGQFNTMIQQGESELEKIRDTEERLQKLLVQQQKQHQQVRISHNQRMKVLKNLSQEFCMGMNELEENHVEQYSCVHNELRKEMSLLQKKILMETQQHQMMNVRKHLKQMLE